MEKIRVLQLGSEDWSGIYKLPENIVWEYAESFTEQAEKAYDLVFLDRTPLEEEMEPLYHAAKAYTLFVTEKAEVNERVEWLCKCRNAEHIKTEDILDFLSTEIKYYYSKPYGEKCHMTDVSIAHGFTGAVKWNGNYSVELCGEYGETLKQVAYWRCNIFLEEGKAIDLWLEYDKDPEVSISLTVKLFVRGSISEVAGQWEFSEEDLKKVIRIEQEQAEGVLAVSLHAKGQGRLRIIALHDRISRGSHGYFLPGGERYVASNREEIFCYFDPGDRKPPLNVYFSGYKTAQGFEGYKLMKKMDCPFLLVSEPRLEGGSFYMGTEEYEKMMQEMLKKYMSDLGFTSDQVIFSGLSMGTYGALYYGCDIRPHAIILGKPLASIGNVAANEKYLRPGGFPTSLDVLMYLNGDTDEAAIERLNNRFWNKFDVADWGKTKFIVSYMIEDDYDPDAYNQLISHVQSEGVQVYGKGIHGRHNDNTPAIVFWFSSQYEKILREDFGRKVRR